MLALSAHGQTTATAPPHAVLYQSHFEQAEPGTVPADLFVLDGAFAVRQTGNQKVLELPGAPLDSYGALFGPTETAGLCVQARIRSTRTGRRCPVFGVGLNGVGGFKLQVSAGKQALEIFQGDAVKASTPFTWTSGTWTWLRLQVRLIKPGHYRIEGKAWLEGNPEPTRWQVCLDYDRELPLGRPAIWGSPIAGTPIQFDRLTVTAVPTN